MLMITPLCRLVDTTLVVYNLITCHFSYLQVDNVCLLAYMKLITHFLWKIHGDDMLFVVYAV